LTPPVRVETSSIVTWPFGGAVVIARIGVATSPTENEPKKPAVTGRGAVMSSPTLRASSVERRDNAPLPLVRRRIGAASTVSDARVCDSSADIDIGAAAASGVRSISRDCAGAARRHSATSCPGAPAVKGAT
jgi:hypothetical protein